MGHSTPARAVTFHRLRRACVVSMPKYNKLTNDFAKWLIDSKRPLIDVYDWAEWSDREQRPMHAATNARLEMWHRREAFPPQRMTRTNLQHQTTGQRKLYYTSCRKSGFALVCIDIDAHKGEADAFETALFVQRRYFPGAYLEPSRRGFHIYVLVRVGRCRRWKFNRMLGYLQDNLRGVLLENNYDSTVEVLGGFTIVMKDGTVERAKLSPMPTLLNGESDLKLLHQMPVYFIDAMFAVRYDSELAIDVQAEDGDGNDRPIRADRKMPARDSPCAWERMQWTCFDFTVQFRRLPEVDELLAYYEQVYATDAGDDRRARRATYALGYRSKTFDIAKATEGGFELHRERLLADVDRHCQDRASNYSDGKITNEDLAIGLYTVMRNSFGIAEDARWQYSCPVTAISGMFKTLKAEKVTSRGGAMPNKVVAIKAILERARLIECVDSRYIYGDHWGVAKKYTVGPACWRYGEFVRFSQNVSVVYVDALKRPASAESKSQ